MKKSYDDHQAEAPLVICAKCGRAFYMTVPRDLCVDCLEKSEKTCR